MVRHWLLTISSWSLQCYGKVVTNTTQLTHWILSLRQFLRLALWNSCEKRDSSTWYERSDVLYNPSREQFLNWSNFFNFMYTTSDMNGHISSTTLDLNELATDKILNQTTPPDLFVEDKQIWEKPTCEGRLIYHEGCVSSLNKSNPTNQQSRFSSSTCTHFFRGSRLLIEIS